MKKILISIFLITLIFAGSRELVNCMKHSRSSVVKNKPESIYNKKLSEEKLSEYKLFLTKLPPNKLESIIKARTAYFKYFSLDDKVEYRNAGFNEFLTLYNKVINYLESISYIYQNEIPRNEYNYNNIKKRSEYLKKFNIKIGFTEATYYPETNYEFLNTTFGKYLSDDWREYLNFSAKVSNEGFTEMGSVAIPWDKMRERIIFLESFLNKYPHFIKEKDIKKNINYYLYSYVNDIGANDNIVNEGADTKNEINPLKPGVKNSYETFITVNKTSHFYPMIEAYYKILKKHHFIVSDDIYDFINKKLNNYELH